MEKRMRVQSTHWVTLLDFIEHHPELLTGKFIGINSRQKQMELWAEVSAKLNSLGLGHKTPDKWKQALIDWKCKVKAKAAEIKKDSTKTGGGPPLNVKLNELEERLIALVGWTAVEGTNNNEAGFGNTATNQLNSDNNITNDSVPDFMNDYDINRDKPTANIEKQSQRTKDSNCKKRNLSSFSQDSLHEFQQETMTQLRQINSNIALLASISEQTIPLMARIANALENLSVTEEVPEQMDE